VIWGYGNEIKEVVTLQPHNKVTFYTLEFHIPQQMNRILLDCSVEGTPDGETHRQPPQVIRVRSGENMDKGLHSRCTIFPVLYFNFSPPTGTSQFSEMIARTGSRLRQQNPHFV
jgi:hypothetical protein